MIHAELASTPATASAKIPLRIERLQLAKRRWRAFAEDGVEFGFDLEHPLHDGDLFFSTASALYFIEQLPEPVIDIALPTQAPLAAARIGWLLGNLHFPVALHEGALRVMDDPAIRQLLDREHIPHRPTHGVFHPISGGHSHAH